MPESQVIARKFRPQSFTEVVGQEAITRTLSNTLTSRRLHHAYLFTGARGVGKTTTARIFAKALNCVKGITTEPCGVCASCTEIAASSSMDVLEIDAASYTGVENVREVIINTVSISPARDRYKIFIIDEVHMLSNSSFNALLKTLEEPPPHVVFILATTEMQKVPEAGFEIDGLWISGFQRDNIWKNLFLYHHSSVHQFARLCIYLPLNEGARTYLSSVQLRKSLLLSLLNVEG